MFFRVAALTLEAGPPPGALEDLGVEATIRLEVRIRRQLLRQLLAIDELVLFCLVRADNQAYTRAAITGIAELCREREIPLFFVNQPLFTWSGDARRSDWGVLPLVAWAEELRAEPGLPEPGRNRPKELSEETQSAVSAWSGGKDISGPPLPAAPA